MGLWIKSQTPYRYRLRNCWLFLGEPDRATLQNEKERSYDQRRTEERRVLLGRRKDRLGFHISSLDRANSNPKNLALSCNFGHNRTYALHLACLANLERCRFSTRLARLQMRRCEIGFG